jgi:hypothetical protein
MATLTIELLSTETNTAEVSTARRSRVDLFFSAPALTACPRFPGSSNDRL